MRTRAHRFLLMLLMLALPLQTFASAAMMACALPHQAATAQMALADEAIAGCHESEPSPSSSHNCKHCTACALASALPIPAAHVPSLIPLGEHFAPHPAARLSGFVPEGPERPPRPTLA
ncbi:MAG: hypothetical protein Q7J36_03400 [Thiobacillus sp.]|nr:hypothetical protein [Thiobacillus sp.]